MTPEGMKDRTKQFAVRTVRLVEKLPRNRAANHVGGQVLRSGTSVGANYRAACRARSPAEFCAKLGIVEEEADESLYWMELIIEVGWVKKRLLDSLMQEANEILAIVVSSIQTARRNNRRVNPQSAIRNPK